MADNSQFQQQKQQQQQLSETPFVHWNVRRIFLSVCQVKWQLSKKKAVSAVAATFASITNKQSDTHTRVHVCTYVCMYLYMYVFVCMSVHAYNQRLCALHDDVLRAGV